MSLRNWEMDSQMFSINEADYMDAAYTPDPGYVYDDDVEVAFKNKIKRLPRKSRVLSPEMV